MSLLHDAPSSEAESHRRLTFLLEASTLLALSLEYDLTLRSLARLSVPTLADMCVIDMLSEDGTIQRVAAAHANPERQEMAETLLQSFPPDPAGPHPVAETLRSGHTQVANEITEPILVAIAADPEHRAIAHALKYTAYIVVPLVARGRTLGAISFVSGESRRRYTRHDVALAEDLARRAALAVDNARLYTASEKRRRAAEALASTGHVLAQTLALEEVAQQVTASVRDLIGGSCAVVYRLAPAAGGFVAMAVSGERDFPSAAVIPEGLGTVGLAVRERGPVTTTDITADSRIVLGETLREQCLQSPHRAAVAVPLIVQGEITGALVVADRAGRVFTADEVALAQVFADQAAAAFHNAHLYEEAERRRSEAEAANRAKDQFLAMLAHELRNPLAPIRSGSYLIGQRMGTDPLVQRAGEIIERQLQHLTRLLDDLLDVARITQGKIELVKAPVDLGAAVGEAVDAVRDLIEAKGHTLRLSLPERPVGLEADATRVVQIIANLLNNAAKYTPANGVLTVTAEERDGWAVVAVRDTGIGIPPELLPRVFDLFSQLDPTTARTEGGLGVGLTLVRRLVELHGGRVTAYSEGPGRGSEFVVSLPAGMRVETAAAASSPAGPPAARRILIVEDNADAAEMLRVALELEGHAVRVAPDGRAGVQAALAEPPELMLVDIGLPGLDGYGVAREVRGALGRAVVMIALTGYGQAADRRHTAEAGFDAHLVKPIDPEELTTLISRW
jgi:signal transduction histidine kinase